MVRPHTKNKLFKDNKDYIRMETNGKQTDRKTKKKMVVSVCEGVKVTNVKTRKELALNRKAKKDLAERAKTHKGL